VTDFLDHFGFSQVVGEPAPHFIDREHGLDVDAGLYRSDKPMMELDVFGWLGLDDLDTGAELTSFVNHRAGFNSMSLGLIAGCDTAGGFRKDRSYTHRFSTEVRLKMLLCGSKVGVEIDE
jgi:hypothetical protein|tara:strand:+ start:361 stop:720 length:360 start_codon:yes stop_codon:yes gene_type:complete